MPDPLVSVVVVTFESEHDIAECVWSVLASAIPLGLIVVDNASSDRTLERLARVVVDRPDCRVIGNIQNQGFAKAVNQGIAASRGAYILVLNPDCVLAPDAIAQALRAIEAEPRAGMAGCMLLNTDGTEQAGARRYFPTPGRALVRVLQLHRLAWLHPRLHGFLMNREAVPSEPTEVEATSGAFMLVRRAAMEEVGVLDEGYFMHCEDLDWCWRFHQAGWKVLFVPLARVVHKKGRSSRTMPIKVEFYKHLGMLRFYRKFLRHRYPALLMWAVTAAVWIRFAAKAAVLLLRRVWTLITTASREELPGRRRFSG